jgi:hypothetical protein
MAEAWPGLRKSRAMGGKKSMNRRGFLQSLIAVPLAPLVVPPAPIPSFTSGAYYRSFGPGSMVMLHGPERIMTLDQIMVRDIALELGGS